MLVDVGRPLPWKLDARKMEAILHREIATHRLLLTVVFDLGPKSEAFWKTADASSVGLGLLPSGPNLWCVSAALRQRAPVEVRMGRRELFELAEADARSSAGVVLCGAGVARHIGDALDEHRFWPVLKSWAKGLGPGEVVERDRDLLARHDRATLTISEMHRRAKDVQRAVDAEIGFAATGHRGSTKH